MSRTARFLLVGAAGTAAGVVVVALLVACEGGGESALQALCKRTAPFTVYALPSAVPPEKAGYVPPETKQGFRALGKIDADACNELEVRGRGVGSPYAGEERGWFSVEGGAIRGWAFLEPTGLKTESVRGELAKVPLAKVEPLARSGRPDLAFGESRTSLAPGAYCVAPGMRVEPKTVVAVTNLGEAATPASFQYAVRSGTGAAPELRSLVLVRGLEPGESIPLGVFGTGEIILDPAQAVAETDEGNNTLETSAQEELECVAGG